MTPRKVDPYIYYICKSRGASHAEIARAMKVSASAIAQFAPKLKSFQDLIKQAEMLIAGDPMYPLLYGASAKPEGISELATPTELSPAKDSKEHVNDLLVRSNTILAHAEATKDARLSLAAIKELRATVELLAKLSGELQTGTQVNIQQNHVWVDLKSEIMEALDSHPEARQAVVRRLEEMTNGR